MTTFHPPFTTSHRPGPSSAGEPQALRRIWLLGTLRVAGPAGPINLTGSRARSVLTFLALQPSISHTREQLSDLLWPDAPPDRARRNFANLLYRLRQVLGQEWLSVEGEHIGLHPNLDLWVDVWEFERLCNAGDRASLEQAAALYLGALAPELYDDWILTRRVLLEEQYLSVLLQLAETAERHDEPELACSYYRRLSGIDPLREDAYRGLMRCLARMGEPGEALATFARLKAVLDQELGIQPTDETQLLAELLRGEQAHNGRAAQTAARPAPFVGRAAERAELLARLDQAHAGKGGLLVLLGESGSGKTRLLQELARAADWRGWQVAWGRAQEFTLPPPHTPLRQALEAALPRPRVQQLARLVQPLWLSMIGGLVPHVAELLEHSAGQRLLQDQRQLPVAMRHILAGLQRLAPQLLILDDMQWADPAIWPLLDSLRQPLARLSVLLVVSGRSDELRVQPQAHAMLQAWDHAGAPIIRLRGLQLAELQALAEAQGIAGLSAGQMSQLATASGGNPLLALTLLHTGSLQPLLEQPSLLQLLQRRLASLSLPARAVLQVAAVLGYRFHYRLLELVSSAELSADQLPSLVSELERSGLVHLELEGYRFDHDTLRAFVYAHTPAEHRQLLHARTLAVLRQWTPEAAPTLLYHAREAHAAAAIAEFACAAGEQALAGYSYPTAVGYFSEALEVLPPEDVARRYAALRGRLRALDILAERAAQRHDLDLLQLLAEQSGDQRSLAEVAHEYAKFFWLTGAWNQALSWASHALELACALNDARSQAQVLEMLWRVAFDLGDYVAARAWIERAQQTYQALGDRLGQASSTHKQGILLWALGEHQAALAHHSAAAHAFQQVGDLFAEARALNSLGCAQASSGMYVQARASHERALAMSRELGDRWGEGANILNLGHVAIALGDYVSAIDYLDSALENFEATENRLGVSLTLSNLSNAYRLIGDLASARSYCAEALQVSRSTGHRRVEGYALHSLGLTLLAQERTAEAREALDQACTIRAELGERDNVMESRAALALAYLQTGELQPAQLTLQQALGIHEQGPALRQWVHYVAYKVHQALGRQELARQCLQQAEAAMVEIAEHLPADARRQFLEDVVLNREIQTALAASTRQSQARLVRVGVPLGRRLTEQDYVAVIWTLYAPEDERFTRPEPRRQHVLRRLVEEALEQGAAPTDEDLARALGVSRRTVLRDMEQLARAGIALPTRRRK